MVCHWFLRKPKLIKVNKKPHALRFIGYIGLAPYFLIYNWDSIANVVNIRCCPKTCYRFRIANIVSHIWDNVTWIDVPGVYTVHMNSEEIYILQLRSFYHSTNVNQVSLFIFIVKLTGKHLSRLYKVILTILKLSDWIIRQTLAWLAHNPPSPPLVHLFLEDVYIWGIPLVNSLCFYLCVSSTQQPVYWVLLNEKSLAGYVVVVLKSVLLNHEINKEI